MICATLHFNMRHKSLMVVKETIIEVTGRLIFDINCVPDYRTCDTIK